MSGKVRTRLMQELQKHNIDAYLAYTPSNLFYTTGFLSPVVAAYGNRSVLDTC